MEGRALRARGSSYGFAELRPPLLTRTPIFKRPFAIPPDRRETKILQPHLFHRVCCNPPTLIIRQRRVIPVSALLYNQNFASSRKSQNAPRTVDRRNSGFGVFGNHNCQALAAGSVFRFISSEPANHGQEYAGYHPPRLARLQNQKNNREPEKNRGHNGEKISRNKIQISLQS